MEKNATDPVFHPYSVSHGPMGGDFGHVNEPLGESAELEDLGEPDVELPDGVVTPLPEEATRPDYKSKDKLLYEQWVKEPNSINRNALMKHLGPLIHSQVNRQSGTLPRAALEAEATIWAMKAVKTFDPSKGFQLSTHVMSYLRKVNRLNYKHQNAARLPEHQQRQYRPYEKARANLENELGREPTDAELARELGWSKAYTTKYKGRLFSDMIESGSEHSAQMTQYSDSKMLFEEIMKRLTPKERMIAELKGTIPAPELAKKLGYDINRLNYEQRKLWNKIKDLQQEVGYE